MCRRVYRPADHLQVALSRLLQKLRRHQIATHRDLPRTNLHSLLERILHLPLEKQAGQQGRLDPAKAGKNRGLERNDHHPCDFGGIAKSADQHVFTAPEATWFEFEVENNVVFLGKFENFLQRGNALPGEIAREPCARVEFPDLRHGEVVNRTAAIGSPVDGLVVNGDKMRVPRELQVRLNKGYALREGTAKSRKSVFRRITGSATMGNSEHRLGFSVSNRAAIKLRECATPCRMLPLRGHCGRQSGGALCVKPNNRYSVVKRKAGQITLRGVPALGGLFLCLALGANPGGAQHSGGTKAINAELKDSSPLAREVQHQLLTLPYYSVFDNLGFLIEGNKVTLYGQVVRSSLKKNAEAEIKSLEGIDIVVNHVEVLPASASDDELRRSIYRSIFEDSTLSRYAVQAVPSIHIIVKNGDVALEGTVGSAADKGRATVRTNAVANVRSVKNNLVVLAKPGGGE